MKVGNYATFGNLFALAALVIFIVGAVLYHAEFRLLFVGLAAFTLAHFAV